MVYRNPGSEVCTLTGGDYEEKNGDYWLKVYQVKMKTYKRIPIPEALYKLVQVYKKKYQIYQKNTCLKAKRWSIPVCYITVSNVEIL